MLRPASSLAGRSVTSSEAGTSARGRGTPKLAITSGSNSFQRASLSRNASAP